jgi:Zn-dependent protease
MNFVQISVILFIAALLLLGGTRGFLWGHLLGRRLGRPSIVPAAARTLPEVLETVLEAAERELLPVGFQRESGRWVDSIDRFEGPRPEFVYRHGESGALAFVGPPLPGTGDRPYGVSFASLLKNGTVIVTFDGLTHLTPRLPAGWECHDHDVNDLGRQWGLHLHALEPHGGLDSTRPVGVDAWNEIEAEALDSALQAWEEEGLTRRTRGNRGDAIPCWRFCWRPAWTMAGTMLVGQRRVLGREAEIAKLRARRELWRPSFDAVTDPFEPALERARAASMAWGYEYSRAARRRHQEARSDVAKWMTGLVSGGACLGVFGLWFGWELAVLLCAVLLLHELGHVVGMAVFGYRDRRILFLPFFGAAAMGEKPDATPGQRTVVLLLGPVPGLLVGIGCLFLFFETGGLWWLALATTALIVNYFNLLPISPLDGGRVVETLLLGRFPRAQVVFLAGGTVSLGLGAWLFRDPILAAMALALVISLRSAWTAANGLVRVRQRIVPEMTRSERVQTVFETLQESPFVESTAADRLRLASIIEPRLSVPPVRPRAALVGALVYFGLLTGTPAAVSLSVYTFQPQLWALFRAGVGGDGSADRTIASRGQSSSESISEASLVGR